MTDADISYGRAAVETLYGSLPFESPAGYAVLEPRAGAEAIASIDGQTVAVRTEDGRCTWYGFSLAAGFGDLGSADILFGVLSESDIYPPVAMLGDWVIPVVRDSAQWRAAALPVQRREPRRERVLRAPLGSLHRP